MTSDPNPPVSDDDFPEFSEPPRFAPPLSATTPREPKQAAASEEQQEVDSVIERLRRERAEGKR